MVFGVVGRGVVCVFGGVGRLFYLGFYMGVVFFGESLKWLVCVVLCYALVCFVFSWGLDGGWVWVFEVGG